MPFTRDEMVRILAACDQYTDCCRRTGKPNARKLRALVRARPERLDADLERAWAQDPIVLVEANGTPEVHGKNEVVN
jgi:hypothetical protein